jgi:hypothetical protein
MKTVKKKKKNEKKKTLMLMIALRGIKNYNFLI